MTIRANLATAGGASDYRSWGPPIPTAGMALQQAIGVDYQRGVTPLVARFRQLADQWIAETIDMSSISDMLLHPAYQAIIGMGPAIIPLLLDELEREPNHWFAALVAVTGENPVSPAYAGDVDMMVDAWLTWAGQRGYR
jgi:hypothetical protein